jgi:hypothetical protein
MATVVAEEEDDEDRGRSAGGWGFPSNLSSKRVAGERQISRQRRAL